MIREIGETDPSTGTCTVAFGPLFYKYADISDSLVGILMRAKRKKLLFYQGDMLFQGASDKVVISVPKGS